MALLFNIYANQELYQASEQIHRQLSDLEQVFPNCAFLQTQKGLLFYHSKGELLTPSRSCISSAHAH